MRTNRYLSQYADLIRALQAGEERALDAFFSKYNRSLLYFAKSMLSAQEVAEEIVADSFAKLWEHRLSFDTIENVKAFLFISTKNACLNFIKSAHNKQIFDYDVAMFLENPDPDVHVRMVKAELMQLIYQEVMKLPEKQREVFRLTYFEDYSTDEIAEQLGMKASAVFANRSRATETLRLIFKHRHKLLYPLIVYLLNIGAG